ncbi:MAG: response regulator transcription factor [Bacteroidota bacterium]|nr:response regulator transcription factor [Bacteroidota bacterium]
MTNKIKIFLVDDHEFFRNGLSAAINKLKNTEVIGEAETGEEFLQKIEVAKPDIVFMDIKMPGKGGIEATKCSLKMFPDLKIVALSMFGDEQYLYSMIEAGVKGFLLKNIGLYELEKAIQIINNGKCYFSEELLVTLTKNIMGISDSSLYKPKSTPRLTKREHQILQLLCKGSSNKDIATTFQLSDRTVENHKGSLMKKFGVNSTSNLILYAIKEKIVEL